MQNRLPILAIALCCIAVSAGCHQPAFVFSQHSVVDSSNQTFDESLPGTWAAYVDDQPAIDSTEPCIQIKISRDSAASSDYLFQFLDPNGKPDGLAGKMRLLQIRQHQYVELESVVPADQPLAIADKPLSRIYHLWHFSKSDDQITISGFPDSKRIEQLELSDILEKDRVSKYGQIITSRSESLRMFLRRHGGEMNSTTETFVRLNRGS